MGRGMQAGRSRAGEVVLNHWIKPYRKNRTGPNHLSLIKRYSLYIYNVRLGHMIGDHVITRLYNMQTTQGRDMSMR